MKLQITKILVFVSFLFSVNCHCQHQINIVADLDTENKKITVYQEFTYHNKSNDTLSYIILNDWINAYSDKNSALGKRFSDEFVRSFHFAKDNERGNTANITFFDKNKSMLQWERPEYYIDLIKLKLKKKLLPNEQFNFTISYILTLPDATFTKIGKTKNNDFHLKNWLILPARYNNEKHVFAHYSNLNLDDAAIAPFDAEIKINTNGNYFITSDLQEKNTSNSSYSFSGKQVFDIPLYIEKTKSFSVFKNEKIEVLCNINDSKVNDIQKAVIVDRIINYVNENLKDETLKKITVSQLDYEKNPFYGLNQLPSFISPFSDEFIYELKFLKTYLNNYLKNTLQLDQRKDNWIFDAIQIYYMMKYIEEHYPNEKMMGNISKIKLLKSYKLINLDFNEQYSYYYMLMARKNLDQPLSFSKDELIKFNEKIASKYRAGLSFKFLADYIGKDKFENAIQYFIKQSITNPSTSDFLYATLNQSTSKNINWFKDVIINSRDIIDYKFENVSKTNDLVRFSIKNKSNTNVPIPVYGIKNKKVVFKEWIDFIKQDSIYILNRNNADKIVLNYQNEVPEFNQRNNWKSLKPFRLSNKPIRFNFLKDLENPFYNQIIYVPTFGYNLYDGVLFGMKFQNKTLLDRPFSFTVNPSFSTKSKTISGQGSFSINNYIRKANLFLVRYIFQAEYFHYAPDATYQRYNPTVQLLFRNSNFRDNTKQSLSFRQIYLNREKSDLVSSDFDGNYSVFNTRYNYSNNELTKNISFSTDFQAASKFGKLSGEFNYRKLYNSNRQLNLRIYSGLFLYKNTSSNYFDFALDRPTDYLFDYMYYGRSESSGFFSQQFILAEGGFKSKLQNSFANQWISTINGGFTIWNWIETYGDLGFIKSKNTSERFVYDSGIRLNLVTDYFELYFPVYSNNGWEIADKNYAEKIRFIVTISPKILVNLFTRKWF